MVEKIGMSVREFISFMEGKVKFIINKANSIIARDGLKKGEINGFDKGIQVVCWHVTHRTRPNNGISLENYLALPDKQQNWSKWLFGLPTDLINSIQYQHKTYPEVDFLGKAFSYKTTDYSLFTQTKQNMGTITSGSQSTGIRNQYRWQETAPVVSLASYDSIHLRDLYFGTRIPYSGVPEGYLDILNRKSMTTFSLENDLFDGTFDVYPANTIHPDREGDVILIKFTSPFFYFMINFSSLNYISCPYLVLKYQDDIASNGIRLDEPLPDNLFEEMLDLMSPKLSFNGQTFRPAEKFETNGLSLIKAAGSRIDKDIGRCYTVQIPSDNGLSLVEVALGQSNIRFSVDYDNKTSEFSYRDFVSSKWNKPSNLDNPTYKDYERHNIFRSLLITEYAAKETQLDGKIEPLWFGWGPLPPSLGFDAGKLSVTGEPSSANVYRPEEVAPTESSDGDTPSGKHLRWNQDINNLFGEVVPAIDPNTSTNHQNINPGKYVLIPDNF